MGRLTYRKKSLLILLGVCALSALLAVIFRPEDRYHFPEPLSTVDEGTTDLSDKAIVANESLKGVTKVLGRTNFRDKRIYVDESFTSNLPLIVLDTDGERPPAHIIWDPEGKQYVPNAGEDIYIDGTVSVLDNIGGTNCLADAPAIKSDIQLRRRGNSSVNYDKPQYLLKLVDENGKKNRLNLLQMGADNEWVLNISFIDKSLLRNYLAYTTAGQIMPYVPDARFCEVVWKDGEKYAYEGVYMLVEKIKVSKDRVDLPSFSENSVNLPFLLRRDRYEPGRLLLNNYARENELLPGVLRVEWPDSNDLSDESVQRITDQIDRFEQALFAENYETFLLYRDMVDIDSFVDYLILNEFFINYDAGFHSTYLYSDYSGKLTMGPVWDYDGAMDNYPSLTANLRTAAFFYAPWFEQIFRDPEVTVLVMERYRELRQSILSDESIQAFIDGTVEGLGSAVERDWARWGYFYQDGNYLEQTYPGQPDRNTKTYEEEIGKLKTVLSIHGAWLDEHFDTLYQLADPSSTEQKPEPTKERNWGGALALVYISIFFVSIALVQRFEEAD